MQKAVLGACREFVVHIINSEITQFEFYWRKSHGICRNSVVVSSVMPSKYFCAASVESGSEGVAVAA